jgi:hypothetical protein
MKGKLLTLTLAIFMISAGVVSAADTAKMSVNVNVIPSEIGIEVPEFIQFEDMAAGYLSARQDLIIANTGTTDVAITAELVNYNESIFSNLVFQDVLTDPMQKVDGFSVNLLKPSVVGEARENTVYMYLDLQEYDEPIPDAILNHQADVLFSAVPLI